MRGFHLLYLFKLGFFFRCVVKGRWIDYVSVERQWRSVKSEDVYRDVAETPTAMRAVLPGYFDFHNTQRRHRMLDRGTLDAVYFEWTADNLRVQI